MATESSSSGLMPHEVDRHLVAAGIYLSRVKKELGRVPVGQVLEARATKFSKLVAQIEKDLDALEEVRTGRKGTRRKPTTIADVTDIDSYREAFVDGQQNASR